MTRHSQRHQHHRSRSTEVQRFGLSNGSFSGDSIPLKSAFAKSINSVAVRLGQEMGIKRIIETAKKMGINSPLGKSDTACGTTVFR